MNDIKKVLFIGSKRLGLRVLKKAYSLTPQTIIGAITIDDGKDTRSSFTEFQSFTTANNIELHLAKNKIHTEQIIRSVAPDLCLVVGWYWLFSAEILKAVAYGFIGIHYSLLPKYRGGSPLVWQIIRGEQETGFSIFSLTPGLDDGPIWAQGTVLIDDCDYVSDVMDKLEIKTIEAFHEVYPLLLSGSIKPSDQNHADATFCTQRSSTDGRIEWQQSAREVYNFIRAQSNPYPGAFTEYNNQVLKIWRAKLLIAKYAGSPGQVTKIDDSGVYVICGDSHVVILAEVELDGKRGRANEFIRSLQTRF